ncbi:hypothetical protein [Haloferula rosea]|uniref:Uncharacterized protein n=1 Tax=Haloferula rosea TaxID=490093 RepID=A0A934RB72_9BACT|nr:hypothetical protein [Haloferula rosea]MBK1825776.1 hypothetical protein [Haloferula rosea]
MECDQKQDPKLMGNGETPSPRQIEEMMREQGRVRRRTMTGFLVGMSLVVYSWAVLSMHTLIVNTEWRSDIFGQLFVNGVFAFFVALPMGFFFMLGYLTGRACLRHSWRWRAASVLPLLLGVLILAVAVRHRLDSGVLFRNILECDLPEGATQVTHAYDNLVLEEHAEVSFVAPRGEIVRLLKELRQEPDPSLGTQHFSGVPCTGDYAKITVEWTTGRVLLTYLNV